MPCDTQVNELCRYAFAVSFMLIRCIGFPYVIVRYVYVDLYSAYMADDFRDPPWLLWFAFSGTVLCCLQLFWGYKIVKILAKQFSGNAVDRSKEA